MSQVIKNFVSYVEQKHISKLCVKENMRISCGEENISVQDNVNLTAMCWFSCVWLTAKHASYPPQQCPDPQSINKTTETYFLKPFCHK